MPARIAHSGAAMSTKHVRNRPSTPGRGAKSANQYFEPGLGRKTGIALKSTGARDEYGLEPVSGIFSSSPASSRRTTAYIIDDGSTGMEGLDSSAPDVEATLHARRTPGIPPARASTPRRSNITGSPQRHSSLKPKRKIFIESPSSSALRHPAAARILGIDDNSEIRQSIEKRTPKKRAQFDRGPVPAYANGVTPSPGTGGFRTNQIFHENEAELEEAYDLAGSILHNSSPLAAGKQRKGKTRRSIETSVTETALDPALAASTSRKRPRRSDVPVDDEPLFHQGDDEEEMFPPPKRQSLPAAEQYIDLQADDGYGDGGNQDYDDDDDVGEPFDEPVGDNGLPEGGASDDNVDVQEVEPRRKKTKQPRPKKDKAAPKVTNRARSVISDDDDAGSAGPSRRLGATVSNVRLRSTTPFEDAGHRTTRSGRAVMKPLNYWAGETVIWKNGEMDGIIRANSVEKVVEPIRRKPPPKTAKKKKKPNLADIDEQDEDLLPSDWEEEIGVLTGDVARFDYNTGIGNDEELVREGEEIGICNDCLLTSDRSCFRSIKHCYEKSWRCHV